MMEIGTILECVKGLVGLINAIAAISGAVLAWRQLRQQTKR